MIQYRFEAMGCEIVLGGEAVDRRSAIEDLFRSRERIFSRFIPESELNHVNALAGRLVVVSPVFADTVAIALRAAEETGGLVDPTLGAALTAAGYARDSAMLRPDPMPAAPAEGARRVFATGRVVGLPDGVHLDLNGVVKGLAVDDALALCSGDGFVSAGGDIATRGRRSVGLPDGTTVELRSGALATSGTTKRWWLRGGEIQHHLIDSATGRPATSPWALVTACGATCLAADIAAKAGFLAGTGGPARLDAKQIPGRFGRDDGEIVTNASWDRSMQRAVACI